MSRARRTLGVWLLGLGFGLLWPAAAARAAPLPPQPSASRALMVSQGLAAPAGADSGGLTAVPDLFTGALTHRIPLELPAGRLGMSPALALTYQSGGGNGWLGVGWDLELGAVERSARGGVSFDGDAYVLRLGGAVDLVAVGGGEYRAKIESQFRRVRKLTAADGRPWFEVTDRAGVRYLFGQTAAARQDDPADGNRIFRWCLERVEDPNGNYYTVTWFKDQGEIYPDAVAYTGNGALAPTNAVRFFRDAGQRADAAVGYARGFAVRTAYRLQSVEVRAGGAVQRAYALDYATSAGTGRSLLAAVRPLGADAVVGASGVATGSALPATSFTPTAGTPPTSAAVPGPALVTAASQYNVVNIDLARTLYGDFDGDGRTDLAYVDGWGAYRPIKIYLAGDGGAFDPPIAGPVRWVGASLAAAQNDIARVKLGDFNGDGRTDMLTLEGTSGTAQVSIYLANPGGSFPAQPSYKGPWVAVGALDVDVSRVMLGDFDGDGKSDVLYFPASTGAAAFQIWLSTGGGFRPVVLGPLYGVPTGVAGLAALARIKLGDFNGDGRTEIAVVNGAGQSLPMTVYGLTANNAAVALLMNGPTRYVRADASGARIDASRVFPADVNGDGKTDLLALEGLGTSLPVSVYLATGAGFAAPLQGPSRYFDSVYPDQSLARLRLGDFNGDGRVDLAFVEGSNGASLPISIHLSEGSRFSAAIAGPVRTVTGGTALAQELLRVGTGDFDGDGRSDFLGNDSSGGTVPASVYLAQGKLPDLLGAMGNGLGGTTSIAYLPSTAWPNTQLPYPVQTVSAVTTDDGNGVVATTRFSFAGGYTSLAERDFRGFHQAVVTGPAGPGGEQSQTRTWFHQGNDTAVDANDPAGPVGWLKGKPYRVQVWDLQRSTYAETLTTYWPAGAAPCFAPPAEVRTQRCELPAGAAAPTCGFVTRTTFAKLDGQGQLTVPAYDVFGNLERENQFGDLADPSDDRTVTRTFSPNTGAWIVGAPASESVYGGAGPATALTPANQLAATSFHYDRDATALDPVTCAPSSASPTPTRGNLTRVVRWLNGGTSPETWAGHDAQGNVVCTSDGDRRVTRYGYDGSRTFRTSVTNALGHVVTTQYYGVDGVPAYPDGACPPTGGACGLRGQPKATTDANLVTVTTQYDQFGRKTRETLPDGRWTALAYYTGGVGTQRTETTTSAGEWSATWFDGVGRTYLARRKGSAAGRVIALRTAFNATGTVRELSVPYLEAGGALQFTRTTWDAQGRPLTVTRPDGSRTTSCYRDVEGASVQVDARGHRVRRLVDAQGRLLAVQEYRGAFAGCTTDAGTPYATTSRAYDAMGRLAVVIDAAGTRFETAYDTLGRKIMSSDPDLGNWTYGHTAGGDVEWQQDARGFRTTFRYDELHRITARDYPTGVDVAYVYDDPAVPYSKGRLTRMTDASGSTDFRYDLLGRSTQQSQVIDGAPYATGTGYDGAGRLARVTYPDGAAVHYQYDDDGALCKVSSAATDTGCARTAASYATLSGYDVLGQVRTIAYGNGVTTTHDYYDATDHRLRAITTTSGAATLLSLSYAYDPVGNVSSVADGVNAAWTQSYGYDEQDRLTSATAPAFGSLGYAYDAVGNFLSKEGVSYTYDRIKVHAVRTTSDGGSYGYDANGNLTSDARRTLAWDYDNRPATITAGGVTTAYGYDGGGARVRKQGPSGTTVYVGKLYECTGGTCTKHVFAGERRIASVTAGAVRYYHADHLGSTRVVTDATGRALETVVYRPFGSAHADSAPGASAHKFTSQELDPETGLLFYNARYYDPALGRFASPDPYVQDPGDPQSLNRFAYVRNNPLAYVDPTGHFWREIGDFFDSKGFRIGLASTIFVATVVATAYTGGLSSPLLPVATGELVGAVTGGLAADRAGGDVSKGILFGTVVGGATGYLGSQAGAATAGLFAKGAAMGYVLGGAATGAITGAGVGATVGYAGGEWVDFGQNVLMGAAVGAVVGGIVGELQWNVDQALGQVDKTSALNPPKIPKPSTNPWAAPARVGFHAPRLGDLARAGIRFGQAALASPLVQVGVEGFIDASVMFEAQWLQEVFGAKPSPVGPKVKF